MLKKNITSLSNTLKNVYTNIENDKSNLREIICFLIFCVATITLSFFHEPWFDEFQALQISKDNLYNILFVIPHFEGHPPLWHLILKCFSHFNINPELCIKIPNLFFIISALWLLIFKSSFPRLIRISLPFTYFLFYQYAIVNRPYSILIFALFLSAVLYKTKNTNPFRFIFSLALLSLTSVYGMLISTCVTIAWVVEIWNKQPIKQFFKSFVKDKRFFAMLILFFICLILAIEIFPSPQNTANASWVDCNKFLKLLYFYFGLLGDCTVFNILNYVTLRTEEILSINYVFGIILGSYLTYALILMFKKSDKLFLFSLVYFVFISFCYFVYIWPHHIGIVFCLLVTLFWYATSVSQKPIKFDKIFIILLGITIITQIYWSVCAYINEIKYDYAPSRQISNYIKKYNLDKYKLMSPWLEVKFYIDEDGHKIYETSELDENKTYVEEERRNTNHQWIPIVVNPYFDKNIFYNFNVEHPDKLYDLHTRKTDEENIKTKQLWIKKGVPDVIIGFSKLDKVWGEDFTIYKNYISIKQFYSGYIWKNADYSGGEVEIYVHKDLYEKMKDYK